MIFVTGDTHTDWISRLCTDSFPEQKNMTKNDYVIICGDFGIWDNSRREKYALDWLEAKPFTTLFLDGNHDNFDILDSMHEEQWNNGLVHKIRPSVFHLMRGSVFHLEGLKIFCFGGGSSHDIHDGILEKGDPKIKQWLYDYTKMYRVNHESWWERELPNKDEFLRGLDNLQKENYKVDYILTHSPYTSLLKQLDGGSGLYDSDKLTNYLQEIKQNTEFKQWFFGHMHINKNFWNERTSGIYEQIVRIS